MALTKLALAARLNLAELKRREIEKAEALGWSEGDPYTAKEIVALHGIHCDLVEEHFLQYKPGGALWQYTNGHVADLKASPILRLAEDILQEEREPSQGRFKELLAGLGAHVAKAIQENDAELFFHLHVILSYRRDGKSLSEITLKELHVKARPGRKPSAIDLSRLFPIALIRTTGNRLEGYQVEGEETKARVSRAELEKVVKRLGGTISNSELSRWITRFEFGPFMAEQPIARNRRKSPN